MGVGRLCKLFGKTRQAFYGKEWHFKERMQETVIALELVAEIRRELPGLGTHKLFRLMKKPLETHGIKLGRDRLHQILQEHGLIIRKRKSYPKTTYSKHWMKKYPNLIKELTVTEAEQVWVSDITYICVGYDFNYLSLITDVYSKKIVGYCLHPYLNNEGPLIALEMALAGRNRLTNPLIPHSDRGVQYCSFDYVLRLRESNVKISMTENGDVYENAIAERVNGILKTEFKLNKIYRTTTEAKLAIDSSIEAYNSKRPHMSCNYLTPSQAHEMTGTLEKKWKPKTYEKPLTSNV